MKTNCELPIDMMHRNRALNDYDFVLFHLYSSNELYRNYYKNLRAEDPSRLMILDNSAYEFFVKGESLNINDYVDAIMDLKPDMFIIPDVLMDKEATLDYVRETMNTYHEGRAEWCNVAEPIAVAQGNTEQELVHCLLEYYKLGVENVAIPFHNSFFKDDLGLFDDYLSNIWRLNLGHITTDMKYAMGRVNFIHFNANILRYFSHVHLLGSHHPFEKKSYHRYDFIKTMDTGYPVKCALAGYELFKEPEKPNIIIDDFLDKELTPTERMLIDNNVCKFRAI